MTLNGPAVCCEYIIFFRLQCYRAEQSGIADVNQP